MSEDVSMTTSALPKPLFVDLDADEEQQVSEIPSLCMNCHEEGMTRMMLTKIPFFREVIISSFQCDECKFSDTDIQYGGKIQDKGIRYEVLIQNAKDLNRQVVKSDSASFAIPSLDFEQPAGKKGEINTVEGLVDAVVRGLEQEQPIRRALDPETAEKIQGFIGRLEKLKTLQGPFKIVLDDPTGNSYVENPKAPLNDEATTIHHYTRTAEQNKQIGLQTEEDEESSTNQETAVETAVNPIPNSDQSASKPGTGGENLKDEVLSFPTNCPNCNTPCDTNMKLVDIPHFKQVIIMCTACDACGNRENEVKSGSGVEDLATRITLKVTNIRDFHRDLLKSDTCGVRIPELELELVEGTLGGRFTTVEGLLQRIKEELEKKNPFFVGDGATSDTKERMAEFIKKLDKVISGENLNITMILDDPAGNSYLQNIHSPAEDPNVTIEHYTRTPEQDDLLGLLQMKTENYEQDS